MDLQALTILMDALALFQDDDLLFEPGKGFQ